MNYEFLSKVTDTKLYNSTFTRTEFNWLLPSLSTSVIYSLRVAPLFLLGNLTVAVRRRSGGSPSCLFYVSPSMWILCCYWLSLHEILKEVWLFRAQTTDRQSRDIVSFVRLVWTFFEKLLKVWKSREKFPNRFEFRKPAEPEQTFSQNFERYETLVGFINHHGSRTISRGSTRKIFAGICNEPRRATANAKPAKQ